MTPITIMKPFKAVWLGRPGEQHVLLFTKRRTGKRILIHKWTDGSGEVEIKASNGDGRRDDFQLFEAVTLVNPTEAEINATVKSLLRHFSA